MRHVQIINRMIDARVFYVSRVNLIQSKIIDKCLQMRDRNQQTAHTFLALGARMWSPITLIITLPTSKS